MTAVNAYQRPVDVFGLGDDGGALIGTSSGWTLDGVTIDGSHSWVTSGRASINSGTLTIHEETRVSSLTVQTGAVLILGDDDEQEHITFRVFGTMDVQSGGTVRAGYCAGQAYDGTLTGGSAQTSAGAGDNPSSSNIRTHIARVSGGGGAAGGGDGTNNGGTAYRLAITTNDNHWAIPSNSQTTSAAGDTGAGTNGTNTLVGNRTVDSDTARLLPGTFGYGGGGGALKQAGGSNSGGSGGDGGLGGGILRVHARTISVGSTGAIHADGQDGNDGDDGVATNAAGDISGGGGGGGGGAAGTLLLIFESLNIDGTAWERGDSTPSQIHASGGSGGTGGAGEEYDGAARASSDGGNGADGSDGVVILQQVRA